jgi:hypothetical protein
MYKFIFKILFITLILSIFLSAKQGEILADETRFNDTLILDEIMREIIINYLTNEDRKLPLENRDKWEESFSEYIDFQSLNNSMRKNVRNAVVENSKDPIDEKTISYMCEKAVVFYLPRMLNNVSIAHVKLQSAIGELQKCSDNLVFNNGEKATICTERSGDTIKAYWVGVDKGDKPYHYIFKKTDKWRLTELYLHINERTLSMIGMWK